MNRQNSKKSKTFWRNSAKIKLKRTKEAFKSPWNPWIIPIEKWGIPGTYDKPIGSVQVLKPRPVSKPKRRLSLAPRPRPRPRPRGISKKSKPKLAKASVKQEEVVEVESDYDDPRPGSSGLGRAEEEEEEEVVESEPDSDDPRPSVQQEEEEEEVESEPHELWMFDKKGSLIDALDVLRNPEIVDDFVRAIRTAAESSDDSD